MALPTTLAILAFCILPVLATGSWSGTTTYNVPVRILVDKYGNEYGTEEQRIKHVTAIFNLVKQRFEGFVQTGVKLELESVVDMDTTESNKILGSGRFVSGLASKMSKLKKWMEEKKKTLPNGITLLVTPRNLMTDTTGTTGAASTEKVCTGAYIILHSVSGDLTTYDVAPRLFAKVLGSSSPACDKTDDGTSSDHGDLTGCLQEVSSGVKSLECLVKCWKEGSCYPDLLPGDEITSEDAFCRLHKPTFTFQREDDQKNCRVKCCEADGSACNHYHVLDGMSCSTDSRGKCVNFKCTE